MALTMFSSSYLKEELNVYGKDALLFLEDVGVLRLRESLGHTGVDAHPNSDRSSRNNQSAKTQQHVILASPVLVNLGHTSLRVTQISVWV